MWRPIPPVVFILSVTSPPALTPPAPLSPRERGEKDQRKLLFYSLLSLGERRGRGGEGRRRGDPETKAAAASEIQAPWHTPCYGSGPGGGPMLRRILNRNQDELLAEIRR